MQLKNTVKPQTKQCSKCRQVKGLDDFSNRKSAYDGKWLYCRACEAARTARYVTSKAIERPMPTEGHKCCRTCHEVKPVSEFYRAPRYVMGIGPTCKACRNEWGKQHKLRIAAIRIEPLAEKHCARCGLTKPSEAFSKQRNDTSKLSSTCRECRAQEYHSLTPEQKKKRMEDQKLRDLYRLDKEGFNQKLAEQNGVCGICEQPMKHPQVDHDHKTRKLRGILCASCNNRLYLVENPAMLQKALRYLERYQ